jgi:hypothetical protein
VHGEKPATTIKSQGHQNHFRYGITAPFKVKQQVHHGSQRLSPKRGVVALFGSRCKPRLNFLTGEISPLLFPHEIHAKGSEDLRIQLQQPARGSSNGSDAYDRGVVNPEVVLPSVLSRME